MPSPPMPPGMPKPPGMPFLTSLMEDSMLAHERVARQAPPQDAPKPPAMESSEHERFARQAPPAPPKRVARQADADNEVAEFESPLQIRQDAFYSTILKISRENKNWVKRDEGSKGQISYFNHYKNVISSIFFQILYPNLLLK